ncbi:MAG TPA: lysozyme inhibitor LprI family protein [Methylocella sp.]|nr:lysozyme inhibitor LprI family protein [Methylocella sp.]
MALREVSGAMILSALAVLPLGAVQAQDGEAPWADCAKLKTVPLPLEDKPSAATLKAFKGCSSEALYYGIGVAKDPGRARQCAYVEREGSDNGWPNLFVGTGILMTIYANGVGADRNFDVAMRFACELEGAPAEEEGWLAHLQKLKKENRQGTDFSPCEDITSGAAMGFCAAHEAKLTGASRKAKLARITAQWSSGERKAFATLEKAKAKYVASEGDNEVDMSGTARAALVIGATEAEEERFLTILQRLIAGDLPRVSASDLGKTDNELNALYQKIQKSGDTSGWGTVTKDGIKKTQRAWLIYRDAFVNFAKVKFSSLAPQSLQKVLTEDRVKRLEDLGG